MYILHFLSYKYTIHVRNCIYAGKNAFKQWILGTCKKYHDFGNKTRDGVKTGFLSYLKILDGDSRIIKWETRRPMLFNNFTKKICGYAWINHLLLWNKINIYLSKTNFQWKIHTCYIFYITWAPDSSTFLNRMERVEFSWWSFFPLFVEFRVKIEKCVCTSSFI